MAKGTAWACALLLAVLPNCALAHNYVLSAVSEDRKSAVFVDVPTEADGTAWTLWVTPGAPGAYRLAKQVFDCAAHRVGDIQVDVYADGRLLGSTRHPAIAWLDVPPASLAERTWSGVCNKSLGSVAARDPAEAAMIAASAKPPSPAGATTAAAATVGPASKDGNRIALTRDSGTFTVPVVVNGAVTLQFIVDSGAADVSIPQDVVSTLMHTGAMREADFIGNREYTQADGSHAPAQVFVLRSLKVGGHTLSNVRASISGTSGMLLLGQSFLERFRTWSIDNANRELVLQ